MNAADRKLRDQFALAAIGAMRLEHRDAGEFEPAIIASYAYEIADAALAERADETPTETNK